MAVAEQISTSAQRWAAIQRRDVSADGSFFYAVKTTGVFCHPSCKSREPRRSNVEFFRTAREAERAGYRACKRCKPCEDPSVVPASILRACELIRCSDTPPSLNELARVAELSPHHFHRVFKRVTGLTPKAFAAAKRSERLKNELRANGTVTRALYASGFASSSVGYTSAAKTLGMTPATYKRGGEGLTLRYAFGECWLGTLLLAATDKGIAAMELGSSKAEARSSLKERFPHATLTEDADGLGAWLAKALSFIERPKTRFDLPFDVQGTAFQQRVWAALRDIPLGTTTTYAQLAQAMGAPKSTRAVAKACATNPIAIATPCHRVIGGDGSLRGYRWGLERKQKLIERENGAAR